MPTKTTTLIALVVQGILCPFVMEPLSVIGAIAYQQTYFASGSNVTGIARASTGSPLYRLTIAYIVVTLAVLVGVIRIGSSYFRAPEVDVWSYPSVWRRFLAAWTEANKAAPNEEELAFLMLDNRAVVVGPELVFIVVLGHYWILAVGMGHLGSASFLGATGGGGISFFSAITQSSIWYEAWYYLIAALVSCFGYEGWAQARPLQRGVAPSRNTSSTALPAAAIVATTA